MVKVSVHRDGAVCVSHRHHWFWQLLGWQERDYEVEWTGIWWVNAATGRAMSWRIHKLIERTLRQRAARALGY